MKAGYIVLLWVLSFAVIIFVLEYAFYLLMQYPMFPVVVLFYWIIFKKV